MRLVWIPRGKGNREDDHRITKPDAPECLWGWSRARGWVCSPADKGAQKFQKLSDAIFALDTVKNVRELRPLIQKVSG